VFLCNLFLKTEVSTFINEQDKQVVSVMKLFLSCIWKLYAADHQFLSRFNSQKANYKGNTYSNQKVLKQFWFHWVQWFCTYWKIKIP